MAVKNDHGALVASAKRTQADCQQRIAPLPQEKEPVNGMRFIDLHIGVTANRIGRLTADNCIERG